jgi:hypothetical protein
MGSFFRGFRDKHMMEFKCALLCDGCIIMVPRDYFHDSPASFGRMFCRRLSHSPFKE